MMNGAHEEQNFWPGYLDALINVMLNLLFLVAVFAMGLVALTLQSMRQMNQISRLNEQATEAVAALDMDASQRQAILQKIEKLNIVAMVANREELDRRRQSLAAHRTQAERSDQTASSTAPFARASASPTATDATAEKPSNELNTTISFNEDKQRVLDEIEEQIKDVKNKIVKERALLLATRQNPSQPLPEMPPEIRTALRAENANLSAKAGTASGVRETLVTAIGMKPLATWEFSPSEFVWAPSRPIPDALQAADKSVTWQLLGFVDPTNARVRREVFARMQAVRNLLIDRGYAKERIQLELRPWIEPQKVDEQAYRLIFMLPPS